ncbi:MAG: family 20 glycosylhydrolase, partial [Bacteroidaceae bacterium]|nr:family 20 glycosylhydrolase [Bacteroidaceae bacterium]
MADSFYKLYSTAAIFRVAAVFTLYLHRAERQNVSNDITMPVTTLEQSYKLDPGYGLPQDGQAHIQGVMATLWAEAIRDINHLTYMTFPRGMAIAEAGWSNMENRSWESFKKRIYPNIMDMMKSGVSV